MPTFELTGPDGGTYQLDAPDEKSALDAFASLHSSSPPAAQQTGFSSTFSDIPSEIYSAGKSALSTIADNLNPFSDARRAANLAQANDPSFLGGMLRGVSQTAGVGAGLAAIPALAAAPITGTARSVIGHPLAAAEHAVGTLINPQVAAQDNPQEMYEVARGNVDTALAAASPRSASSIGARTFRPIPTAQELREAAKTAYQSPDVKTLAISPYATDLLGAKIESDLSAFGYRPSPANAPGTFSAIKELHRDQGAAPVSVDDIDSVRKALGVTAKQRDQLGKPTPDASAASAAIRQIDDFLTSVAPADVLKGNASAARSKLLEARGNYAAGKRASEIDFRLNKAERAAARSGSGMNIENSRRQKIDQVSDYGLTPDEVAQRDKIVLGTPARNALRTVGKLGVDGGLSLMLHAGSAIGTGGATLPVTAAGTAARLIGQALTKRQINQLNEMIRVRAPLSRATPPKLIPAPASLLSALYPNLLPVSAIPVSESVKNR